MKIGVVYPQTELGGRVEALGLPQSPGAPDAVELTRSAEEHRPRCLVGDVDHRRLRAAEALRGVLQLPGTGGGEHHSGALRPGGLNAVFPGGVATEIFQGLPPQQRTAEEERFSRQPLPRIGQPDEVAQAYLYLMKCGYTTGQIVKVDGGSGLGS